MLTIDIDGWDGPLDLLLLMARQQKVDLRDLSVLALVDQYLAFLEDAHALPLDLAADYLVMAAWLAYLKSGLLLPGGAEAEPGPEELAARLHRRLQRLDAMRQAGSALMARDRIGRDVFLRGAPEGLHVVRRPIWQAQLYDLIAAYATVNARTRPVLHVAARAAVMTLEDAIRRVEAMLGEALVWTALERFLPAVAAPAARSARASSFLATLELARQGKLQLKQDAAFATLWVRSA